MKTLPIIITLLLAKNLFSQNDHSLQIEWGLLKATLVERNNEIGKFVSVPNINKYFSQDCQYISSVNDSLNLLLIKSSTPDSMLLTRIEPLENSLYSLVIALASKIQSRKDILDEKTKSILLKTIESYYEKVSFQVHDYNYWVNEVNHYNLAYKINY